MRQKRCTVAESVRNFFTKQLARPYSGCFAYHKTLPLGDLGFYLRGKETRRMRTSPTLPQTPRAGVSRTRQGDFEEKMSLLMRVPPNLVQAIRAYRVPE